MELAGITLDREALAKQANAWDQELITLKNEIAKLGISNPSSARQVATWLSGELARLDATNATNLASNWPRTPSGSLSTTAKHLRRLADDAADRRPVDSVLAAGATPLEFWGQAARPHKPTNRSAARKLSARQGKKRALRQLQPQHAEHPQVGIVSFGLRCTTWQAASSSRTTRSSSCG